jgi:hypothetical protein
MTFSSLFFSLLIIGRAPVALQKAYSSVRVWVFTKAETDVGSNGQGVATRRAVDLTPSNDWKQSRASYGRKWWWILSVGEERVN